MKCLVLGGRGFIGSHLVDQLLREGHAVRSFDRPNVLPLRMSSVEDPNLEEFDGDFTSAADLIRSLEGCAICFHLISTTILSSSNLDPVFDVETNLVPTIRMLAAAKKAGVKKVVFISSGGTVYGNPHELPLRETHSTEPVSSYGITKLAIEKYLHLFHALHGIEYAILRLSNPYGERQRHIADQGAIAVFAGHAIRGEPIEIWGDGSIVRDYIHVSDVVSALVKVMGAHTPERIFNIGSGTGHSLLDIVQTLEKTMSTKINVQFKPGRSFDVEKNILCIDRAKNVLDWSPQVSFSEGVARFVTWFRLHKT